MKIVRNKKMVFSLASVSVIILFLQQANCARIPLQVDITKMAHCDDSKRAGNGDKVSENRANENEITDPIYSSCCINMVSQTYNVIGYGTLWRVFDGRN